MKLSKYRGLLRQIATTSRAGLIMAFVVLFVTLSIGNQYFLNQENLMTVLRQAVFVTIAAYGMTFVISMGGIDLSVGAVMAVGAIVAGKLMASGCNMFTALLIAIISGTLLGAFTGIVIAKVHIPDFIATMAMMSIARGGVQVYTKGIPIYALNAPEFAFLAQGFIGPIPFPIVLAAVLFFICYYLLYHTAFGRYVVSIGSNAESARLVGINISVIKVIVYSLSGLLAATSGVLLTSRLTAAMPELGLSYEMDAIAATVIGGTSLSGGKASLLGTAFGSILMALVRNGLNLLNINTFWHQVVLGSIVMIAVGMDVVSSRIADANR
jgi:ribose transport system permease protein